jgi:hypothetical protein
MTRRHEIAIDHTVPLLDEMTDRMPTRLSATTGEEDSHVADGTELFASAGCSEVSASKHH